MVRHSFNEYWQFYALTLLGVIAVYLLLPKSQNQKFKLLRYGLMYLFLASFMMLLFTEAIGLTIEILLFAIFSLVALLGAVSLVSQANPARSAISFTLVVISVSGLFLLLSAPFLMATTIIVYAGAIIVTFLFVLMLAQQSVILLDDVQTRLPLTATSISFIFFLVAVLVIHFTYSPPQLRQPLQAIYRASLATSQEEFDQIFNLDQLNTLDEEVSKLRNTDASNSSAPTFVYLMGKECLTNISELIDEIKASYTSYKSKPSEAGYLNIKSSLKRLACANFGRLTTSQGLSSPYSGNASDMPTHRIERDRTGIPLSPANNVSAIAHSLYTDHLLSIEIAGTLLLIATIGSVVISQRKSELA